MQLASQHFFCPQDETLQLQSPHRALWRGVFEPGARYPLLEFQEGADQMLERPGSVAIGAAQAAAFESDSSAVAAAPTGGKTMATISTSSCQAERPRHGQAFRSRARRGALPRRPAPAPVQPLQCPRNGCVDGCGRRFVSRTTPFGQRPSSCRNLASSSDRARPLYWFHILSASRQGRPYGSCSGMRSRESVISLSMACRRCRITPVCSGVKYGPTRADIR